MIKLIKQLIIINHKFKNALLSLSKVQMSPSFLKANDYSHNILSFIKYIAHLYTYIDLRQRVDIFC